jgi:hypothetical protein
LHIARKERRHDEWDPPIAPYDPYAPGESNDFCCARNLGPPILAEPTF